MTRRALTATILAAAAALLAACGTYTNPTANPLSTGEAPKVAAPLSASKFVNAPCGSLTMSDLATLNLTGAAPNPLTTSRTPNCGWTVYSSGITDSITWMTENTTGLESIYQVRTSLAYFAPTTVSSYPAVYNDYKDSRQQGSCAVSVATSDTLFFDVSYRDPAGAAAPSQAEQQKSCGTAERTAEAVIKNLKG